MYRKSAYSIIVEAGDGHILLYNTRTGAFAALDPAMQRELEAVLENPQTDKGSNLRQGLIENGFLVREDFDELGQIRARNDQFRHARDRMGLTMLASENCNFRCPYCFIYDRRGFNMKPWVYEAALKMVRRSIVPDFKLTVDWFGGEPTLSRRDILSFMRSLNDMASENGIAKPRSRMVTNGYLLTPESFEEYVAHGITGFQVTIDGGPETHNKTRVLRDGRGTFDRIWRNLAGIHASAGEKDFRVWIRANFLQGQDEAMNALMDRFQRTFDGDRRFSIYFRPVYNFATNRSDNQSIESSVCTLGQGMAKQMEYNMQAARKTGFLDNRSQVIAPTPDPIAGWCEAERENSWSVGADGLLFKCDTYAGNPEMASGRLRPDGTIERFDKTFEWDQSIYDSSNSKCLECKFLPICQGGCARGRITQMARSSCYYTETFIREAMLKTHEYHQKEREGERHDRVVQEVG